MTSSRRSWQKSMSKSGIDTRSGLRKRSNSSENRSGSTSVMVGRIGDQRAGARAAPGTDRNSLSLRPFDEVGDDQEVAGVLHLLDDGELEFQPLAVILRSEARGQPAARQPLGEALARLPGQLVGLRLDGRVAVGRVARRKARQDRVAGLRIVGTAARDLDGIVDGLGDVCEQRRHLGLRAQMIVGRQPPAVVLGDHRAVGNRHQRVMCVEIVSRQEERLVGGDQRQVVAVGEVDRCGLERAVIARQPLDLDVEPVAEQVAERKQPLFGELRVIAFQRTPDRAFGAAGQADDAVGETVEDLERQMHRGPGMRFEIGAADQPHQVAIAGLVGGDQDQWEKLGPLAPRYGARAFLAASGERKVELAADDRLHALFRRLLGEFERAEQIVGVGDGDSGREILGGLRHHFRQRQRAFEQRIGGMNAQMDEGASRLVGQRHCLTPQRVAWKSVVRHGFFSEPLKGLGDRPECMILACTKPVPWRTVPSAMLTMCRVRPVLARRPCQGSVAGPPCEGMADPSRLASPVDPDYPPAWCASRVFSQLPESSHAGSDRGTGLWVISHEHICQSGNGGAANQLGGKSHL